MQWLYWLATNWVALVVVLLAFGFIIFVHELGHFMIAKRVGVRVHEFALGFGPKIFSRKNGETEYCLRIFPFGGFVRMEGEDEGESDPNDPGNFQNKSVGAKMAVLVGGCAMNYLSALIVLLVLGFVRGLPDLVPSNQVTSVMKESPAEVAGIKPDDKIVAIDGKPVENFRDLMAQVRPRGGQPTSVTVLRGDQKIDMMLTPAVAEDNGEKIGRIGVTPSNKITLSWTPAAGPGEVFGMAGGWLTRITLLPVEIVKRLVHKEMTVKEVGEGTGGPLLIGQMLFELYHQGIWALLFFWAIICTSVGSFNLLPIPALDGARILFVGIGALRGRPLDPHKEGLVHFVGLMVLLAVMALFTLHDISRMWKGVHFF